MITFASSGEYSGLLPLLIIALIGIILLALSPFVGLILTIKKSKNPRIQIVAKVLFGICCIAAGLVIYYLINYSNIQQKNMVNKALHSTTFPVYRLGYIPGNARIVGVGASDSDVTISYTSDTKSFKITEASEANEDHTNTPCLTTKPVDPSCKEIGRVQSASIYSYTPNPEDNDTTYVASLNVTTVWLHDDNLSSIDAVKVFQKLVLVKK